MSVYLCFYYKILFPCRINRLCPAVSYELYTVNDSAVFCLIILGCKQTKDDNGSAHKKEEMDFDAQYGQDNADGETFDHGYYSYDGYDDDGAGGYNGIDDFDFE